MIHGRVRLGPPPSLPSREGDRGERNKKLETKRSLTPMGREGDDKERPSEVVITKICELLA